MERISTNLWAVFSIIPALLIVGLLNKESDIHRYRLLSVPTNTATITLTPSFTPSTTPSLTTTPTTTVVPTQTPYPTYTPNPTPTLWVVNRQAVVERIHSVKKVILVESTIHVNLDFQANDVLYFTDGTYKVIAGVDKNKISTENIITDSTADGNRITVTLPDTEFFGLPNPIGNTPNKYGEKPLSAWSDFWQSIWPNVLKFEKAPEIISEQRKIAEARACEYGILEYAADNARIQWASEIREMPGVGKFTRIDVIVNAGNCP